MRRIAGIADASAELLSSLARQLAVEIARGVLVVGEDQQLLPRQLAREQFLQRLELGILSRA